MKKLNMLVAILALIFLGSQNCLGQCYTLPSPDSNEVRLFAQDVCGAVDNNPQNPTTFTIDQPQTFTKIGTYHWNHGKGTETPGTIGLQDSNGKIYGPWKASGQPGQGGVPNACWIVTLTTGLDLPAGTYEVVDSDPSTWPYNSESGDSGVVSIVGLNVVSGKKAPESVPLADLTQSKPALISFPSQTLSEVITPANGGTVQDEGMSLTAPPGAVSANTNVVVKRLTGEFPPGTLGDSVATVVSKVYDFGLTG
jgi:hypothetical protein